MSEGNGHTPEVAPDADVMVLSRNRSTGEVNVGGNVINVDLALDILGRVSRYFDVQYRVMAAMQAQEELKKRQAEFATVQSLLRK